MTDRNEQIKAFAEKNNLTPAEAELVYGTNSDPDEILKNYSLLQEIKTSKVRDSDQIRETDLEKQTMDLLNQADEALKAGNTARSISLRRQAFDKKR